MFSHCGRRDGCCLLSYFMVAVGRKFLWSLFKEIRHATFKLETLLREASPVHSRCQKSAVLRVQNTVRENNIKNTTLLCKLAECLHLEYFIHFWSLSFSKPYNCLKTAVPSVGSVKKNANRVRTIASCLVHAGDSE